MDLHLKEKGQSAAERAEATKEANYVTTGILNMQASEIAVTTEN
jgi:hypothetical protein